MSKTVFVLTGYTIDEGATVLGVYSSCDEADTATTAYRVDPHFKFDTYFVNAVMVDAPAAYHGDGELIQQDIIG